MYNYFNLATKGIQFLNEPYCIMTVFFQNPTALHMSVVSWFFKISMHLRNVHSYLTEQKQVSGVTKAAFLISPQYVSW